MDRLAKDVCKRLPLAEAVLRMLQFVCDREFCTELFSEHRGRAYEGKITFASMVSLLSDALLRHGGSGHKSFQHAKEDGRLEATIRAAYGKFARLPLAVSIAFLSAATMRLRQLFPEAIVGWRVPESLREFEVIVHDGKKIKHVAKRLGALRKTLGQIMGGKLVVSQSLNTGLALTIAADRDGEAADQPLVPSALAQLRQVVDTTMLHIADRMFCDLVQVSLFRENGDHFLLRWHRKVKFRRDDAWETIAGTDRYGRRYLEEWGWIGGESDSRRCYVRRITLKRTGGDDVILLSDLVDHEAYPADDLLEAYLCRWGIETMFQKVTEVFHLQNLIGSTPEATVFQASFCFLLYNMIEVMRAWIASGQDLQPSEVSTANLFNDVHEELIAWNLLLNVPDTVQLISPTKSAAHVRTRLEQLLFGHWKNRWKKSPSNTHVNPPPKRTYLEGGHSSVARLVENGCS